MESFSIRAVYKDYSKVVSGSTYDELKDNCISKFKLSSHNFDMMIKTADGDYDFEDDEEF